MRRWLLTPREAKQWNCAEQQKVRAHCHLLDLAFINRKLKSASKRIDRVSWLEFLWIKLDGGRLLIHVGGGFNYTR
jgi:hypothetical protein